MDGVRALTWSTARPALRWPMTHSGGQATPLPVVGQTVRVRTRTYLVESVETEEADPSLTIARGACLDDDAQGDKLDVVWGLELNTQILDGEAWKSLGKKGFDDARELYRNPPAHTRFLPLASALRCKDYVDRGLTARAAWAHVTTGIM